MKIGDIILATDEALKEYNFALVGHRYFKIIKMDAHFTEIVSIHSDDVKLIGSIDLNLFTLLDEIETVNNILLGLLSTTKIVSFEARTACGRTIKVQ